MNTQSPFGEVIYAYTRAQAIEDGVLVDVSKVAREAGIGVPVAVTRELWTRYVEVPKGCEGLQDESGRIWDVVYMLRHAIRTSRTATDSLLYKISCVTRVSQRGRMVHEDVTLKSVCGPGDNAEPVITIMLPEED